MRPENQRMQAFLRRNGIEARVKRITEGTLKDSWRLYNPETKWSEELAAKLNGLGFLDLTWREPFTIRSGNGGVFSVFAIGHDELLNETGAERDATAEPTQGERMFPGITWHDMNEQAKDYERKVAKLTQQRDDISREHDELRVRLFQERDATAKVIRDLVSQRDALLAACKLALAGLYDYRDLCSTAQAERKAIADAIAEAEDRAE